MDNSKRDFSKGTLDFFKEAMAFKPELSTIITFHYPAPNDIHGNSINPPEWDLLKDIYEPYKSSRKYIIAGHLHSYFESSSDDIPLVVTGGAGAQIEFVNDKIDQSKAFHHIVSFSVSKDGDVSHEHIRLDNKKYCKEITDERLTDSLDISFKNECMAHVRYKIFAEDAHNSGFKNLAKLFEAIADSEYYHAKNHFLVLENSDTLLEYIKHSLAGEEFEVDIMYKEYLEFAQKNGYGLAAYSFLDSLQAEKVHGYLLSLAEKEIEKGGDIPEKSYATCTSCGYTFSDKALPERCPICGAPHDKIKKLS